MKILYLSPYPQLADFLQSNGDEVAQTAEPLIDRETNSLTETAEGLLNEAGFIVSYGYRFKVSREVVDRFAVRAINLHISYLPWNRGADPNLWSFLEDTPKGVTIHFLDGNIDTGDIIIQRPVDYDLETDTLKTTHARLMRSIEEMFRENWPTIRSGKVNSFPQTDYQLTNYTYPLPQLTFHRSREKDAYQELLTRGWDTKIKEILGKARV